MERDKWICGYYPTARNLTLFLLFLILVSGCGKGYEGSGTFREITRTYIPVIGVKKGYMIEMPVFSTDKDCNATYSLKGMPQMNNGFTVQLLTYTPDGTESFEKRDEINGALPDSHEIYCALIDRTTSRVVAERTEKLSKLPGTPVPVFQLGPFLKYIFETSFAGIPAKAELEIKFEYRTKGVPLKRNMRIILLNDAPTA